MKKSILIIYCMWLVSIVTAQNQNHLHLKSGKTFSTFLFKDSESNKEKNLNHLSGNYFGVSYDAHLGKRSVIRPELGFREAGASTLINETKIQWNFSYLDMGGAYIFNLVAKEKTQVYAGAGINLGFLLMGEQSVGNAYFDVKKERAIKTLDLATQYLAGTKIKVSENIYVSLEYRYQLGLLNIETDGQNPDQVSRNRMHGIVAGLSFNLSKNKNNEE